VLWTTFVGPAGTGTLGGIEWGTATDGNRIYAQVADSGHVSYPLLNGPTITWGAWSGFDAATGKLIWQTADPTPGAEDFGAVSVANGVVYWGSGYRTGTHNNKLYAFSISGR
jgi:polyvinyl alcohol dehydrogenase (cytochrome)